MGIPKKASILRHFGLTLDAGSELTAEQVEFGRVMHRLRGRLRGRTPTWSEVLREAVRAGYRRVETAAAAAPTPRN